MGSSLNRVKQAAADLDLDIEIIEMPDSTRTAVEAAEACNCEVGQIVKSLVFSNKTQDTLFLFLVAGNNQVDMVKAATVAGQLLERADPTVVRKETGFAIGGVSPLGHKKPIATFADQDLLSHSLIWAAAGSPKGVFSSDPRVLLEKSQAKVCDLKLP